MESLRLTRDRRATQGVQGCGPETRPTLKRWQALPPRSTPSDARPDSDFDLLVVMPQATLTPQERQQATRSLRAALRPLPLSVGVDLVVVGAADAERLAGSRWHVVARALREGRELHVAG